MRSAYPCLTLLASLLACGPGGGTTTDTGNSTTQGPGATTDDTAPATSEPTSEPTNPASNSDPSGATTEPSTTGPATTGPVTTGPATTDPVTSSTTGEPGTTGTSTGDDTGGPPGQCQKDADCKLQDDCCTCAGIPGDLNPVPCDLECKQSKCSELGIDAAVCRLGVCETERLSCDQTQVLCDSLPPVCPKGQLPTTSPDCWTGKCVPAELCDVIPDCSFCPGGHLCVQNIDLAPSQPTCEPIPPGCGDDPDCACAGELVCTPPHDFCVEQPGPVIQCECINC